MPDKPAVFKPWMPDTRYSFQIINLQRVFALQAQVTGPGCVLVQIALSGATPSEVPDALDSYGEHRAKQMALNFYNACPLARDHGMIPEAAYWQIRATEIGEGFVGYQVSFTTDRADQNAHQA